MRLCLFITFMLAFSFHRSNALDRDSLTIEDVRLKIEAMDLSTVTSPDGSFVISGDDPMHNAVLLSLLGQMMQSVQSLTGLDASLAGRSVRILIAPPGRFLPDESIRIEHVPVSGGWVHRVVVDSYETIETLEALERLCAALLSVYFEPVVSGWDVSLPPPWLAGGVLRGLTPDDRARTLESALTAWSEGQLPFPLFVLGDPKDTPSWEDTPMLSAGVFVIWLSGLPERGSLFETVFARLSSGQGIDLAWLQEQLPAGRGDPVEQWDRWLLSQRSRVRSLGSLSLTHLDALYAEWLIYPGRYGIPRGVDLIRRADCSHLLGFRDEEWFVDVVRNKRYRIEMLAAGRPANFQQLVKTFVDVLDALEFGAPDDIVQSLAANARYQWRLLREDVRQADQVSTEESP